MDNKYMLDILFRIKKRPGIYLGEKSLRGLKDFISGFCCIWSYGIIEPKTNEKNILTEFTQWLEERHHMDSNAVSSCWNILQYWSVGDYNGFDFFYSEFEKFLAFKKIPIPKIKEEKIYVKEKNKYDSYYTKYIVD